MIIIYSSNNEIPNGYLLCDGSEISRNTYNKLFNIIGITYGEGDDSTTFNLPDLTNKFIEGSNIAGTDKKAGLPNITGAFFQDIDASNRCTGVFTYISGSYKNFSGSANHTSGNISFNASKSNSIYGNSTTVRPLTLTMKYIIKAY